MIGLGAVTTALGALGLWLTRRGRLPDKPLFWRALIWTTPLAILANGFGWIFTEMGRQPWVVFGEMFTREALSPVTPAWQVIISLAVFTAVYIVLAVVALRLLIRYAQAGPPPDETKSADTDGGDRKLAFAY